MAAVDLKGSEFNEFIKAEYAIVDCYGDNCSACVMLAPVFEAVADELSGIAFGRINVSEYAEIMETYNISAIPTVLFFRKGELTDQFIGSMEREELLELVAKLLYQ